MNRARLMRYGMDQVSTWLPALLMMLFALGSWWLVRSAPQLAAADGETPVSQEPDYFMRQFSVRTFDAGGRLKSELQGVQAQHFPADDTLRVTDPRLRSVDEQGHPTLATAQRAVANGDESEVRLYGDAHVVRDPVTRPGGGQVPKLEFRGEFLHVFIDEERVSSDQPVVLTRGADRFTGNRFEYSDKTGVARLQGKVRGLLQPARR